MEGCGVESAFAHAAGEAAGLTLEVAYCEAAVMAGDAGTNVVHAALAELINPLGIAEQLTCNADSVDLTGLNGCGDLVGVMHSACAGNGNVDEILYVGNLGQVACHGHVYGGMSPIPGVVGAVICVEHVSAGCFEDSGNGGAFFHGTAELNVVLAGQSAFVELTDLAGNAVADGNGIILAAGSLDAADDLGSEAQTVLDASAVLVGTVVHVCHGKLVKEVTLVDSVDLNAVDTCLLAEGSGLAVSIDNIVDLFNGERSVLNVGIPYVGQILGGSYHGLLNDLFGHLIHAGEYHHGAAEACAKLHEELAAVRMDLVHKALDGAHENIFLLIEPIAIGADSGNAGDHKANVSLGAGEVICAGAGSELAVMADDAGAAHCAKDDSVLDGGAAYFKGSEKCFVAHFIYFLPFMPEVCRLPNRETW